jgi:hypothetical protein
MQGMDHQFEVWEFGVRLTKLGEFCVDIEDAAGLFGFWSKWSRVLAEHVAKWEERCMSAPLCKLYLLTCNLTA